MRGTVGDGTRADFRRFALDMSDEFHAAYFTTRKVDERAMSRNATDPRAAAAHAQMADHYEAMALVFGAKPAASATTVS